MTSRDADEYRHLRDTIRERGTARVWVFVAGLAAWGLLLTTLWRADRPGWALLVPLVVLAGAFEAVFALHVGTERIGRYIQVFHERDHAGWEHHVMALGRAGAMTFGGDALFSWVWIAAIGLNVVAAATAAPASGELVVLGGAHLAAVGRVLDARRRAATQRAADLETFKRMQ